MSTTKLGTLQPLPGENWVTHKVAREQIRLLAKEKGLKLGTFRSKAENRTVVTVPLADGSGAITAKRQVGADILLVPTVKAEDIPSEVLAQINADTKKG